MGSNVLWMINIAWTGGSPSVVEPRAERRRVVLHRRDKTDCVARVYFRDALPEAQPDAAAELPWLWIGRGELSRGRCRRRCCAVLTMCFHAIKRRR